MSASRVVIVKGKGVLTQAGEVNQKKLLLMYERGFQSLTGLSGLEESLESLFSRKDRIGIKINTIAGRRLSSLPEVAIPLASLLAESIVPEQNIIIWDRTNRELKDAGYRLNLRGKGIRIFGTDTDGIGYSPELIAHRNIGSMFSSIQRDLVSASTSFAILKDHGLAGVTAGMKNYFGAVHNPNKYHDFNCDPFVAELFETDPIKSKHKLSILDALLVQFHRGPSFHTQWAKQYEALIFSSDPVAADVTGWNIIEALRKEKGLPTLKEEQREPKYLFTAEKMGLGKAAGNSIQIIEEEV